MGTPGRFGELYGRLYGRLYGANPLHLVSMLACFALVGYVIAVLGPDALWDPETWWRSIVVWFLGAVIVHDLVLFPAYALADRAYAGVTRWFGRRRQERGRAPSPSAVPTVNHVRVPVLASGLLLVLFLPGIIEQGSRSYAAATGQTQDPYLERWLLLTAGFFALSALTWAVREFTRRRP